MSAEKIKYYDVLEKLWLTQLDINDEIRRLKKLRDEIVEKYRGSSQAAYELSIKLFYDGEQDLLDKHIRKYNMYVNLMNRLGLDKMDQYSFNYNELAFPK